MDRDAVVAFAGILNMIGDRYAAERRPLPLALLDEAEAAIDRRHKSYEASFRIARVLLEGAGMSLDPGTPSIGLPGFLFEMNRFFQALITRFLGENLDGHAVHDEGKTKDLYAFDVARNPLGKSAPSLRPDFPVVAGARMVAVLDAKYRDLWGKDLPAAMLYQLSLYALAHPIPSLIEALQAPRSSSHRPRGTMDRLGWTAVPTPQREERSSPRASRVPSPVGVPRRPARASSSALVVPRSSTVPPHGTPTERRVAPHDAPIT